MPGRPPGGHNYRPCMRCRVPHTLERGGLVKIGQSTPCFNYRFCKQARLSADIDILLAISALFNLYITCLYSFAFFTIHVFSN